jgi:hypothetical protein
MKTTVKYFLFSSLFATLVSFFVSCNEDPKPSTSSTDSPSITGNISANINGVAWSCTTISSLFTKATGSSNTTTTSLIPTYVGSDSNFDYSIGLVVPDSTVAKSYNSIYNFYPFIYLSNKSNELYIKQKGDFTFTKVDRTNKKLEGTFNFIGTTTTLPVKSVTVSGGVFSIRY